MSLENAASISERIYSRLLELLNENLAFPEDLLTELEPLISQGGLSDSEKIRTVLSSQPSGAEGNDEVS